jgi:hypothetical protein
MMRATLAAAIAAWLAGKIDASCALDQRLLIHQPPCIAMQRQPDHAVEVRTRLKQRFTGTKGERPVCSPPVGRERRGIASRQLYDRGLCVHFFTTSLDIVPPFHT